MRRNASISPEGIAEGFGLKLLRTPPCDRGRFLLSTITMIMRRDPQWWKAHLPPGLGTRCCHRMMSMSSQRLRTFCMRAGATARALFLDDMREVVRCAKHRMACFAKRCEHERPLRRRHRLSLRVDDLHRKWSSAICCMSRLARHTARNARAHDLGQAIVVGAICMRLSISAFRAGVQGSPPNRPTRRCSSPSRRPSSHPLRTCMA